MCLRSSDARLLSKYQSKATLSVIHLLGSLLLPKKLRQLLTYIASNINTIQKTFLFNNTVVLYPNTVTWRCEHHHHHHRHHHHGQLFLQQLITLLVGLPLFWHEASKCPSIEWEKWRVLFAVATMAMNELTRSADETNPRVKELLGDMPEEAANKKVVSMMFLPLGEFGRKMFRDKYRETSIWTLQATDRLNKCHSCFHIEINRTSDRHNFLSSKQLPTESSQQFCTL